MYLFLKQSNWASWIWLSSHSYEWLLVMYWNIFVSTVGLPVDPVVKVNSHSDLQNKNIMLL